MKKQFILLFLFLSLGYNIFSQSNINFKEDEKIRIKFATHLITYDTIGAFDNSEGEAYYLLVLYSFNENLQIPKFTSLNLSPTDKEKIEKIILMLNMLKENPPSWDELLSKQILFLEWLDKAMHKTSKYLKHDK